MKKEASVLRMFCKKAAISARIAKLMGASSGKAATKLVNRLAKGPLQSFRSDLPSFRSLGLGLDKPEVARAVERHLSGREAAQLFSRKGSGKGFMSNYAGQGRVEAGQELKRDERLIKLFPQLNPHL